MHLILVCWTFIAMEKSRECLQQVRKTSGKCDFLNIPHINLHTHYAYCILRLRNSKEKAPRKKTNGKEEIKNHMNINTVCRLLCASVFCQLLLLFDLYAIISLMWYAVSLLVWSSFHATHHHSVHANIASTNVTAMSKKHTNTLNVRIMKCL